MEPTSRKTLDFIVHGRSFRNEVWALLTLSCGAANSTSARREFVAEWPECREFRFMGKLGPGGKVYWTGGRLYVGCYGEDRNEERADIIVVTNEALDGLLTEHVHLYEVGAD